MGAIKPNRVAETIAEIAHTAHSLNVQKRIPETG